jgi:hypothetical protein
MMLITIITTGSIIRAISIWPWINTGPVISTVNRGCNHNRRNHYPYTYMGPAPACSIYPGMSVGGIIYSRRK